MSRKYELPLFLTGIIAQESYERWLHRRAVAHVTRDRKRGNKSATNAEYKIAIHEAILRSNGRDCYTGERLDWSLISTYNNKESKSGRQNIRPNSLCFLASIMLMMAWA